MKKHPILKLVLKIAGGLFLFLIVAYIGIAVYVSINKKEILQSITAQLNDKINGSLTIEKMEPELLRGLPGISFSLSNVLVRDSLWNTHHKDLLKAKDIYVAIDVWALLKGTIRIRDVNIHKADICIFIDRAGYSNTSIFTQKRKTGKVDNDIRLNHLNFTEVTFVFENNSKSKLFRFDIAKLKMELKYAPGSWKATVGINTLVKDMSFNTGKGSFIKNKRLVAGLNMEYDKDKDQLTIPQQNIKIGSENIGIGGHFAFATKPITFLLNITASKILFKNARPLLTQSIAAKLNTIDFLKPVDIAASIAGRFSYPDTPLVKVSWHIKDNTFLTPAGDIACSFSGSFINELVPGMGHNDINSGIALSRFEGTWQEIPVKADTVRITNLKYPVLEGKFTSRFPLVRLNPILGDNIFHFDAGTADIDLIYKGGIEDDDTTAPYIYGTVKVAGSSVSYVPRSLDFTDVAATLKFTGSDLLIEGVKVRKGTNVLNMDGSILNFLNLYYAAPDKIWLDWNIKSPQIDLNEFKVFLAQRKSQAVRSGKSRYARINKLSGQLDQALEESNVHMMLDVKKVIYKRFTANDINAEINLMKKGIKLQNISLKHAGGSLKITGEMQQQGPVNQVSIKANVDNVDVSKFFYAFDNFWQEKLTDKNVKGTLSTAVNVTGKIQDNGQIVPKSFVGTASFELKNGELSQFEPLMDISKFIFRKRHLEQVTFNTIKNKFDIKGDKITIYPMRIESSAINMSVAGIYALTTGTDIKIDVQLRNPKKDELIDDNNADDNALKGALLHLRAVDDDSGKVSIKWDVLNRSGKSGRKK